MTPRLHVGTSSPTARRDATPRLSGVSVVALIVLVLVAGGCRPAPVGLRTIDAPPEGPPILCTSAAVGPFRIVIDPAQPNPVWGIALATGERFEIVWPPGFRIGFAPDPVLIDSRDRIVAHSGDVIDDAGGSLGDPVSICSLGDEVYPLRPSAS